MNKSQRDKFNMASRIVQLEHQLSITRETAMRIARENDELRDQQGFALTKVWSLFKQQRAITAGLNMQMAGAQTDLAAAKRDVRELRNKLEEPIYAKPLSEWHEDNGPVTWWKFPIDEPAWVGTPTDSDWPGYHTHWTPHPALPDPFARDDGLMPWDREGDAA